MRRRAVAIGAFCLAVAWLAAAVWWLAFGAALDQLSERGRSDLTLAADRLAGELRRYRELAVVLADHPQMVAMLETPGGDPAAAAAGLLRRNADRTGTRAITLRARSGTVLASSGTPTAAVGPADPGPHFRRAMNGALGIHHARAGADGTRVFQFAAPVWGAGPQPAGAVVVTVDMAAVETDWSGDPQAIYFTDAAGAVFVSNRSELLFRAEDPDAAAAAGPYDRAVLRPFPEITGMMAGGHELWRVDGGPYLPSLALHLVEPVPVISMRGELLLDAWPAVRLASWQALGVGALCLVFGAFLFLVTERRRTLAERLEIEAAANQALEARVAARTGELSEANRNLRREIGERREAEAALKKAQADLVQAGKLSALGQMSAGISHELNQPLMAIRSFAENAAAFIDRGKPERASENLARISELARRMGRIIKNLRAFARQENEPIGRVDLGGVVEAVLEISAARLTHAGVAVDWAPPRRPVIVRGGEVRLQQVVLNLVSNAIDAMEGAADPRIAITIGRDEAGVTLSVRDTGPGLSEPEKIFDPFYSTKEVGQSEGMGLGLSISYGIVQSFGGRIRGRNHPEGGAIFTVELSPWEAEAAA